MSKTIEVLQSFIGVQECPIDKMHCIADWQTPCVHFRGLMLLSGGYYGVVCTGAIDQENIGDESSEMGIGALQSSLCNCQCGNLPTEN